MSSTEGEPGNRARRLQVIVQALADLADCLYQITWEGTRLVRPGAKAIVLPACPDAELLGEHLDLDADPVPVILLMPTTDGNLWAPHLRIALGFFGPDAAIGHLEQGAHPAGLPGVVLDVGAEIARLSAAEYEAMRSPERPKPYRPRSGSLLERLAFDRSRRTEREVLEPLSRVFCGVDTSFAEISPRKLHLLSRRLDLVELDRVLAGNALFDFVDLSQWPTTFSFSCRDPKRWRDGPGHVRAEVCLDAHWHQLRVEGGPWIPLPIDFSHELILLATWDVERATFDRIAVELDRFFEQEFKLLDEADSEDSF